MQNSHLKNSLIAAGIAVFAGVVTLGANVAFGGTNPSQDPATAGLIGPTFSGLTSNGDVNIQGLIKNPLPNSPVRIGSDLTIYNNNDKGVLDVQGLIKNYYGSVKIDDSSGLDVQSIQNTSGTPGTKSGAVNIDDSDGLHIGDLLLVDSPLMNIVNQAVGKPVKIDDDLNISGNLDVEGGVISNSNSNKLSINETLYVNPSGLPGKQIATLNDLGLYIWKGSIFINDPVLTPMLKFSDFTGGKILNLSSIVASTASNDLEMGFDENSPMLTLHSSPGDISTTIDSNLKISGSILNPTTTAPGGAGDVIIADHAKVNGTLTVGGKITASGGFGTITPRPITNSTGVVKATCNYGEILLSCSVSNAGGGFINDTRQYAAVDGTKTGPSCTYYLYNNNSASATVTATCLDTTK